MSDPVLEGFLRQQLAAGMELASHSDLVELHPQGLDRYVAVFRCKGLVRTDAGEIEEASEFHVGIWFPSDPSYCRHADAFNVLTWLHPQNIFHPNIRPPFICADHARHRIVRHPVYVVRDHHLFRTGPHTTG